MLNCLWMAHRKICCCITLPAAYVRRIEKFVLETRKQQANIECTGYELGKQKLFVIYELGLELAGWLTGGLLRVVLMVAWGVGALNKFHFNIVTACLYMHGQIEK